jgi:hypothetical protein
VIALGSHDKVRAHTGDMEIGKKPKKHESVWCPHCRGTNTEPLKQQRSTWEGDQKLEKKSVRDESIWDVTHLYMESPCIAILISTSKNALSFLLLFILSLQQN